MHRLRLFSATQVLTGGGSPGGTLSKAIFWEALGFTDFIVRFGLVSGGTYPYNQTSAVGSTTLTGLTAGTWYWTVAVVNGGIEGEHSPEESFTV